MPRPGPDAVRYEETRFGFIWGAARIERIASLPGGRVVIGVTTDTGRSVDVYVSRTGRSIRVFEKGKGELTP